MCSRIEHEKIEEENNEFFKFIRGKRSTPDAYNSWLAVILFYITVHHVESIIADLGKHSTSHHDRESYLKKNIYQQRTADARKMSDSYEDVKHVCNRARYSGIIPTTEEIEDSKLQVDLFTRMSDKLLTAFVSSVKNS